MWRHTCDIRIPFARRPPGHHPLPHPSAVDLYRGTAAYAPPPLDFNQKREIVNHARLSRERTSSPAFRMGGDPMKAIDLLKKIRADLAHETNIGAGLSAEGVIVLFQEIEQVLAGISVEGVGGAEVAAAGCTPPDRAMTVAELTAALSRCPQGQLVYVEGDETGDFPVVAAEYGVRLRFTEGRLAVRLDVGESDYDGDEDGDGEEEAS
jgi:hypothetical protein